MLVAAGSCGMMKYGVIKYWWLANGDGAICCVLIGERVSTDDGTDGLADCLLIIAQAGHVQLVVDAAAAAAAIAAAAVAAATAIL